MNSREKVIVGVSSLLFAYLAYELLSGNLIDDYKTANNTKSVQSTSDTKTNSSDRIATTDYESALIDGIHSSFKNELISISRGAPVLHNSTFIPAEALIKRIDKKEEKEKTDTSMFTYSSYLEAGTKKVVVINNFQYIENEKIFNHPFSIAKITPQYVILKSTENNDELKVLFTNISTKKGF